MFDVLSEPYLGRQTRTVVEKITVLVRASDMVLVAHHTTVRGRLVTTTVETVRFARPERVDFRLTRGPVPHVVEQFMLEQQPHGTRVNVVVNRNAGCDVGKGSRGQEIERGKDTKDSPPVRVSF